MECTNSTSSVSEELRSIMMASLSASSLEDQRRCSDAMATYMRCSARLAFVLDALLEPQQQDLAEVCQGLLRLYQHRTQVDDQSPHWWLPASRD